MATGERPVLETLADINAASLVRSELDPATLLMVRLAALIAVDAPRLSYLMHVGPAVEAKVTVDDVQDVLVAVAPIVGAPRVVKASGKIAEALGLAVAIAESDAEASGEPEDEAPGTPS